MRFPRRSAVASELTHRAQLRLAALHHLVCLVAYGASLLDQVNILPLVSAPGQIFLLSELSTVFANLRWFSFQSIGPRADRPGSPEPVEPPTSPAHRPQRRRVLIEEEGASRRARRRLLLAQAFETLFLAAFFVSRICVGVPVSVTWWLRSAPHMPLPAAALYAAAGVLWHAMNFWWLGKALCCPRGRGSATKSELRVAVSVGSASLAEELACEMTVSESLACDCEIWFRESLCSFSRLIPSRFLLARMTASARVTDGEPSAAVSKTALDVSAASPQPRAEFDDHCTQVHGVWYDLSEFSHPGGPVALSLAFNRDATALFEAHHMLTSRQKLRAILKKYEIPPDSKRAKALEAGKVDEGAASPYLWPRADVTGRSDPGEPDRFEEELKEMAQAHFSAEAKRRGISMFQATKATPKRWLEIALVAAGFMATTAPLVRGEWWALFLSPVMAWIWLANMFHDGCHFALSSSWQLNAVLPYFTPWLCSPTTWYHQHVVGHHAYPNVGHKDPDLAHAPQLLRHHESIRWRPSHLRQASAGRTLFIWVVATFGMQILSDLRMVLQGTYNKVVPMQRLSSRRLAIHLAGRLAFVVTTFCWPWVVFLGRENPDWRRAVLFSTVPMALFSLCFMMSSQVNHLSPGCHYEQPQGAPSTNYYRHQVQTAQNFMVRSRLVFLLSGGLNFQVEHHLFPTVCHCHLPALQPKVQALCAKHGVPYYCAPSWAAAYRQHMEHTRSMAGQDGDGDHHDDPYEGVDPTGWVWGGALGCVLAALCC